LDTHFFIQTRLMFSSIGLISSSSAIALYRTVAMLIPRRLRCGWRWEMVGARGVATGVDIGIYTPPLPKKTFIPQNKFLATPLVGATCLRPVESNAGVGDRDHAWHRIARAEDNRHAAHTMSL